MNYAEKLRKFADYLDARPDLLEAIGSYDSPSVHLYYSEEDKATFSKVVASLDGAEKNRYQDSIYAYHFERAEEEEDGYRPNLFGFHVEIRGVCEKKPTGEIKARPVHIPSDAYQGDDGKWYVAEPQYDYECPPLLSLSDD